MLSRLDPKADVNYVFSKSDAHAAKTFASVFAETDRDLLPIDEILRLKADGNLVTFGSPTSNLVARVAMGYAEIGDGRRGAEHHPHDGLHLPLLFELNGEKILRAKNTAHHMYKSVVNNTVQEIPNWGLRLPKRWIGWASANDGSVCACPTDPSFAPSSGAVSSCRTI